MAPLFAAEFSLDLSQLGGWFTFGLRLIFAVVGGVIGWYATPPLFRLLFRLAFQRPAPGSAVLAARFVGALALGALLFLYAPGTGGSGFGFGGGGGGWFGSGSGKGDGDGKDKGKGDGKDKGDGESKTDDPVKDKTKERPKQVVVGKIVKVELVVSKRYVPGSGRWYLLDSKEPPHNLDEIEAFFKDNKGKFSDLDIILYGDSVEPGHFAVTDLKAVAERHGLRWFVPPDYAKKTKGS